MKKFTCKNIGMDCAFEASAETEGELMQKVSTHAKEAHGMENIDEATMQNIKAAIKDEAAEQVAEEPAEPEASEAAEEAPKDSTAEAAPEQ